MVRGRNAAWKLTGLALAGVLAVAVPPGGGAAAQTFVSIATGGTAGVYYPLGGAMAKVFTDEISGVDATAQSTGASVANVNFLRTGQVELALIQNDIGYYAASGTESFDGQKVSGLRGVATLYPETIQIVTTADTGIRTLDDMRGKRVAVGAPGSGTEANARQILGAAGMDYGDIEEDYLSFAEAVNNMKDGNADAAFITAGHPAAAVTDLAASEDVVIVSIPEDVTNRLLAQYSFFAEVTVPKGTYSGLDEDVQTVAVMAMLATTERVDDELVYNLTKALFENVDDLAAAHSVGRRITLDSALDGMSLDLHPGAERYYREQGVVQ